MCLILEGGEEEGKGELELSYREIVHRMVFIVFIEQDRYSR